MYVRNCQGRLSSLSADCDKAASAFAWFRLVPSCHTRTSKTPTPSDAVGRLSKAIVLPAEGYDLDGSIIFFEYGGAPGGTPEHRTSSPQEATHALEVKSDEFPLIEKGSIAIPITNNQ